MHLTDEMTPMANVLYSSNTSYTLKLSSWLACQLSKLLNFVTIPTTRSLTNPDIWCMKRTGQRHKQESTNSTLKPNHNKTI